MISDEWTEHLVKAGELIETFCDKEKGYYAGVRVDPKTGKTTHTWNRYEGAKNEIEKKLKRKLSQAEQTILALATGGGPTPYFDKESRDNAFEMLWKRHPPTHTEGSYAKMMNIMISFY